MVKGWALRPPAVSDKDLTRGGLQMVGHRSVCHHAPRVMVKGWALRPPAVSGKGLPQGALQREGHCRVCHQLRPPRVLVMRLGTKTTSNSR
jgi:hypothetical protein